jgi:hypothetical protein
LDIVSWSRQVDDLLDAVVELRRFFDERSSGSPLVSREMRNVERLFDRYLNAHDAVTREVEGLLRRDTKRPRR